MSLNNAFFLEAFRHSSRLRSAPLMLAASAVTLILGFGEQSADDPPLFWQSLGPNGGYIAGVTINPQNRSEIFALTAYSPAKFYSSIDTGNVWKRISSIDYSATDLVVAPSDPATIYGLSPVYYFKSTNAGLSWTRHSINASSTNSRMDVHPADPNTVYVACRTGSSIAVVKTTDGGATWRASIPGSPAVSGIGTAIAISPSAPSLVYLGGERITPRREAKIFKSPDGGTSWEDVSFSSDLGSRPEDILIDPGDPSRVIIATMMGVHLSTDGGRNWDSFPIPASALAIDPADPMTIYAGGSGRAFRSRDGGRSWAELSAGNLRGTCRALAVGDVYVYFASNSGIFRIPRGGSSWQESQDGLTATVIRALAVVPSNPRTILAAIYGDRLVKSEDSGATWRSLPEFYRCDDIVRLRLGTEDGDIIYALARDLGADELETDEILKSADGGLSWARLFKADYIEDLIVDRVDPDRIIAVGGIIVYDPFYALAVFRSTDGGAHWTTARISDQPNSLGSGIAQDPHSQETYYMGSNIGFLVSLDRGRTWFKRGQANGEAVAVHPTDPARIFLGGLDGLLASSDGGTSWDLKAATSIATLGTGAAGEGLVYGGGFSGILISLDLGEAWFNFNNGLESRPVKVMTYDASRKTLFAGTHGHGIFSSPPPTRYPEILAPLDLEGERKTSRSLSGHEEMVIGLRWRHNPKNEGIVQYRIYLIREGLRLPIAEVDSSTFSYLVRHVEKSLNYQFAVAARRASGEEGEAAVVTVI